MFQELIIKVIIKFFANINNLLQNLQDYFSVNSQPTSFYEKYIGSNTFANFISLVSLFLGIYSSFLNKPKVYCKFSDIKIIDNDKIKIKDENTYPKIFQFYSEKNILITLNIVNPFSYDLDFFDLKVIDIDNPKKQYSILTKTKIRELNYKTLPDILIENSPFEIPDDTKGVLKSHSQNSFNLLICPNKINDKFGNELYIFFQIPVKTWLRKAPYAEKGKERLKWYYRIYECNY